MNPTPQQIAANVARWRKEHGLDQPRPTNKRRVVIPIWEHHNGIKLSPSNIVIDIQAEVQVAK